MTKLTKKKSVYDKYKTANIIRFVAEVIFIFSLILTYATMVTPSFNNIGPIVFMSTIISLIISIIFEIKRIMLIIRIKKQEKVETK